jgi:hypothetical protein
MSFDPENILKGRIGESLVEELLKKSGNKVYRFGYEAVLQNLTQLEKAFDRENEVGKRIKSIPDFIVINKEGKPFFVEVKFRTNLIVFQDQFDRIDMIEKFWKAKIIIVTTEKPYFRISDSPYLNTKREWNWNPLKEDKDFGISDDILKEFNGLIEKYYPQESKRHKDNPF